MSKKEYIKPRSEALDLASRESLMQSSPFLSNIEIEEIIITNYEW